MMVNKQLPLILLSVLCSDIPPEPFNVLPQNFSDNFFHLMWKTNGTCIKHYTIINSTIPLFNTTTNNITINATPNELLNISVAGVDFANRKGPHSQEMCIKLSSGIVL